MRIWSCCIPKYLPSLHHIRCITLFHQNISEQYIWICVSHTSYVVFLHFFFIFITFTQKLNWSVGSFSLYSLLCYIIILFIHRSGSTLCFSTFCPSIIIAALDNSIPSKYQSCFLCVSVSHTSDFSFSFNFIIYFFFFYFVSYPSSKVDLLCLCLALIFLASIT